MNIVDEIEDILDEPKSFYFLKPLRLPTSIKSERVEAYNLIFRKNNIDLKIEDGYMMFTNKQHPNSIKVSFEKCGLVKELLYKLFGSYLTLKNDFEDEFEVKSSYSKIEAPTVEELELIQEKLSLIVKDQTFDISYVEYDFAFKDTDLYTINFLKNLTDYTVERNGGLWRVKINEIRQTPEIYSKLISNVNEPFEDFLIRVKSTLIEIIQKENKKHLDILNDGEMLVDILKNKI